MKEKLTGYSQVFEKGDTKKTVIVWKNLTKHCYVKKSVTYRGSDKKANYPRMHVNF